jgi:uncharacterized protein
MEDSNRSASPRRDEVEAGTPITTVIRQRPLPDAVERYEAWLKEIIPVAQSFAGHQSVSVIRPQAASAAYTIVLHFDSIANLRRWLDSGARIHLVEKIKPYLREPEDVDIKTGFEFWFTPPPAAKPAKPYKQFLITLSAIFPLTILVPGFCNRCSASCRSSGYRDFATFWSPPRSSLSWFTP